MLNLKSRGSRRWAGGEHAAITLASSYQPESILLIDDSKGRKVADSLGIQVLGTLGVLDLAAARGLLNLPDAVVRLLQTSLYVSPSILKALLAADTARKRSDG